VRREQKGLWKGTLEHRRTREGGLRDERRMRWEMAPLRDWKGVLWELDPLRDWRGRPQGLLRDWRGRPHGLLRDWRERGGWSTTSRRRPDQEIIKVLIHVDPAEEHDVLVNPS
jgi:hypothetical protein